MFKQRILAAIIATVSLSACTPSTHISEESLKTSPSTIRHNTAHLTHWELSGAIAAKQHQKAWSASMTWEQESAGHYRISLFGPMGGNAVTIEKNGHQVTYQENGHTQKASDINDFIRQKTGQSLPVTHLFYWIRGLKSPGHATETRDSAGHLVILKQAGYTLTYGNYELVDGYDLPTKIEIHHANGWMKLIVKNWAVHA